MGTYLNREDIFSADDMRTEEVEVPEWGGAVLVRGLTASERDSYEESCLRGKGADRDVSLANVRAKLVVRTVVDPNGERVFEDGDAEELGSKSASAVDRIFGVAQRLSRIGDDDVEELVKDSSASP